MSPRVIFVVRSRRGLGHVVRATCVAEALRALRPDARVALAVSHPVPGELIGDVPTQIVAGQALSAAGNEAVREFRPDVVLFDTVMPADWRSWMEQDVPPRLAFMMREMTPEARAALDSHAAFSRLDRVLIPHAAGEFDPEIDGATHVGPIARNHGVAAATSSQAVPLVVSTAGGGGHVELCEPFIAMCLAADRKLRRQGVDFDHHLVTGPRFDGRMPDPGAVRVTRFEPRLPAIMAAARLVISRAGYNTVNELEVCGTPAILVPGNPGLDDQRRRAERAAAGDRISIVEPGDVDGLVLAMRGMLSADPPLRRVAANGERWTTGAFTAARELLALCERDRTTSVRLESESEAPGPTMGEAPTDEVLLEVLEPVVRAKVKTLRPLSCARADVSFLRSAGRLERVTVKEGGDEIGAFYAKPYDGQRGRQLFERMRALRNTAPIARPVAYLGGYRTLVVEEARGLRLDRLLRQRRDVAFGPEARAGMRALGGALVSLHALTPPYFPLVALRRLVAELDPEPAQMPSFLSPSARLVAQWLGEAPDPAGVRAVLCHRDLHPRQVFVDGPRITMIDLDHSGLAHPAVDLANLTVYLEHKFGAAAAVLSQCLYEGYEAAGGQRDVTAELIYDVFTRLRLTAKVVRTRVSGWQERAAELIGTAVTRCTPPATAVSHTSACFRGAS